MDRSERVSTATGRYASSGCPALGFGQCCSDACGRLRHCVANLRSWCAHILRNLVGLASSACLAHKAVRKCCEGDCKVIAALWWRCAASRGAGDHWCCGACTTSHATLIRLAPLSRRFRHGPLSWPHLRITFRFTTEVAFRCVWRVFSCVTLCFDDPFCDSYTSRGEQVMICVL